MLQATSSIERISKESMLKLKKTNINSFHDQGVCMDVERRNGQIVTDEERAEKWNGK